MKVPMAVRAIRCPSCRAAIAADVVAAVGGACPHCHRPLETAARHERAVAQTLEWADQAAARGDHADALAWLNLLETMGHRFSNEYQRKREKWRVALHGSAAQGDRDTRPITGVRS